MTFIEFQVIPTNIPRFNSPQNLPKLQPPILLIRAILSLLRRLRPIFSDFNGGGHIPRRQNGPIMVIIIFKWSIFKNSLRTSLPPISFRVGRHITRDKSVKRQRGLIIHKYVRFLRLQSSNMVEVANFLFHLLGVSFTPFDIWPLC